MDIVKWLPYIPVYPNTQIPETKNSSVRVVEPSTRSDVKMTPTQEWHERVEKLRESQRSKSAITYGPDGTKRLITIKTGQLFSFYV